MSGSAAEERIRGKVEAALRQHCPHARIVHELVLETSTIRIDLAAVSPDHLVVAEIKSERDVLKRLPAQIAAALEVAGDVWVVIAEKHQAAIQLMLRRSVDLPEPRPVPGYPGAWTHTEPNPAYLPDLLRCRVYVERVDGDLEVLWTPHQRRLCRPQDQFEMLWAPERRAALRRLGAPVGPRDTCWVTLAWAVENLSGRDIRRAVMAQLRARRFPRADPAIPVGDA
jgi:hypothetical protein